MSHNYTLEPNNRSLLLNELLNTLPEPNKDKTSILILGSTEPELIQQIAKFCYGPRILEILIDLNVDISSSTISEIKKNKPSILIKKVKSCELIKLKNRVDIVFVFNNKSLIPSKTICELLHSQNICLIHSGELMYMHAILKHIKTASVTHFIDLSPPNLNNSFGMVTNTNSIDQSCRLTSLKLKKRITLSNHKSLINMDLN